MGRPKKDAKYLNVYLSRQTCDEFTKFCENIGQSKSLATERAIKAYMKDMTPAIENITKNEEKGIESNE